MSLFVCDICHAVDNTATGAYINMYSTDPYFKDPKLYKKALCCECAPPEYKDGSRSPYGSWHNKFPKEIATKESLMKRGLMHFVWTQGIGDVLGVPHAEFNRLYAKSQQQYTQLLKGPPPHA